MGPRAGQKIANLNAKARDSRSEKVTFVSRPKGMKVGPKDPGNALASMQRESA